MNKEISISTNLFVGAGSSPSHVLARAELFVCSEDFFWECVVLILCPVCEEILVRSLQGYFVVCIKDILFALCKVFLFAVCEDFFFFDMSNDILFAVWGFILFAVCGFILFSQRVFCCPLNQINAFVIRRCSSLVGLATALRRLSWLLRGRSRVRLRPDQHLGL